MSGVRPNELLPTTAWRLLLPTPGPAAVSIIGADETLAMPDDFPVVDRLPLGGPSPAGAFDLVVADRFDDAVVAEAFRRLGPGGVVYIQQPCSWTRRPRTGRPAGGEGLIADRLLAAGFAASACYWFSPGPDRWQSSWWVPAGAPQVVRYLAAQRRPPRSRASARDPRAALAMAAMATVGRAASTVAEWPWLLHPRRPAKLCLVAVKACEGQIPSALPWPVQQMAACRSESAVAALRMGGSSSDQPIMLRFDEGDDPVAVIKFPDNAEELDAGRRERAALLAMADSQPEVSGVPRPIDLSSEAKIEAEVGPVALGQSGLAGPALTSLVTPRNFGRLADAVTDWTIGLARSTAEPARPGFYRDLIDSSLAELRGLRLPGESTAAPTADRLAHAIGGLDLGLVVRQHRDLGPWNVHRGPDGQIGVLDWAITLPAGPPGCDLVHFLAHLALCAEDAYAPDRRTTVVAMLGDPRTHIGAVAADCLARYLRALGLDLEVASMPNPASTADTGPRPGPEINADLACRIRLLTWMVDLARQPAPDRADSQYHHYLVGELESGLRPQLEPQRQPQPGRGRSSASAGGVSQ